MLLHERNSQTALDLEHVNISRETAFEDKTYPNTVILGIPKNKHVLKTVCVRQKNCFLNKIGVNIGRSDILEGFFPLSSVVQK